MSERQRALEETIVIVEEFIGNWGDIDRPWHNDCRFSDSDKLRAKSEMAETIRDRLKTALDKESSDHDKARQDDAAARTAAQMDKETEMKKPIFAGIVWWFRCGALANGADEKGSHELWKCCRLAWHSGNHREKRNKTWPK